MRETGLELGFVFAPALFLVVFIYGPPSEPARYLYAIQTLYRNIRTDYPWYLFGEFKQGGYAYYYLAALSVKTAVPLLALGVSSLFLLRRRNAGWLAEVCLFAPAVLLVIASSSDTISAGIRRVLPVLPVLAISASRWVAFGGSSSRVPRALVGCFRPGKLRPVSRVGLIISRISTISWVAESGATNFSTIPMSIGGKTSHRCNR